MVAAFWILPLPGAARKDQGERVFPRIDWTPDASSMSGACASGVFHAQEAADRLAALPAHERNFGSTVGALETLVADLNDGLVAQRNLQYLSPDPSVRLASQRCSDRTDRFLTDLESRPDVYRAIADPRTAQGPHDLYRRRLRSEWLSMMRRGGAALPDPERARLVGDLNELRNLEGEFLENLDNDFTTMPISAAQAASLPWDFVQPLRHLPEGGYSVPVNEGTLMTFLTGETDAEARGQFALAYNNRAAAANVPLLQAALAKRDDAAHLLGYPNWAAYAMAPQMAAKPERVRRFLEDLDERLLPKAKAEIARLVSLKSRLTGTTVTTLEPGDYQYYSAQMRRIEFNLDQRIVREYFPLEHVMDGIMNIYGRLFGVAFERVTPAYAWSQDVTKFMVTDARSGRLIGYVYFDLYARPGKYGHVANIRLLPTRRLPDGDVRAPATTVVGNFPTPPYGRQVLLSHPDVSTLFHEVGHAMAALLADTPYETLSAPYVRDFVEAPSQMLENWPWDPAIIKEISYNIRTGEPMSDPMIARLIASRNFGEAYHWTRNVALALVDLDYHTAGARVDTTAIYVDVFAHDAPLPPQPGTHPQASWTHEMDGYASCYYAYAWDKVLAQDMFTVFNAAGLENPSAGLRYREIVLAPARALDPQTEMERFVRRAPSANAFYRDLGLDREQRAASH